MTGHIPRKHFAETLEELAANCGPHGEAAVADAEWGGIMLWLMHAPSEGALINPPLAAIASVSMMRDHDRVRLGYPHHTGGRFVDPLASLPADSLDRTRRAAEQTRLDWEQAGRPGLNRNRLKATQQYVVACTAKPINETNKDQVIA